MAGSSVEDSVNRRDGHVAVEHKGRVLVLGGDSEEAGFWSTEEILIYNSLTQKWTSRRTTGNRPIEFVYVAATVMDDTMYVVDLDTSIWSLDLDTYSWGQLEPIGIGPLRYKGSFYFIFTDIFILIRCDINAVCWTYGDKVFLFGGTGPAPTATHKGMLDTLFEFCGDPSNPGCGWSNQLVVYNSLSNRWEWPKYSGQAPSPRSGHSVSVVGNMAYVFGGWGGDTGKNDLHCLDLVSMKWSLVVPDTVAVDVPLRRFGQTMTPIHTGSEEGLLLYGGRDSITTVLGDCWWMDLHQHPHSWVRCSHLELGPRSDHAAVVLDSQVS